MGIEPRTLVRRHAWGWYERVAVGVYRDVAVPGSERSTRFATLLAVARGAVLARETAGLVHGLGSTPPSTTVHVVVCCTCPHERPGTTVHRSLTLRDSHVTSVAGQPVTTATRTLCDLANVCGPVRLRRLVAEAVRRGLTSAADLRTVMDQMGRFRGKAGLRDVVEQLSPLEPVSRSALESEFLSLTTSAGIPPTMVNHPVVDGSGQRRWIDAVYLPPGLPIELDSRLAHGSLLDWHDDLRRENDLALRGWLPFQRFNWFDVTQRGHLVVSQIKRALAAA